MATVNENGIDLIKSFEGCRLEAYQDQRGIWTIGYGATGADVYEGLVWTQEQANERLADDLLVKAETPVNNLLKCELTDNQFAAFCSLCYNIGTWNFAHSSALSEANAGNLDDVPNHIALWDEVDGIPDKGLIRRRQAEIALWETP